MSHRISMTPPGHLGLLCGLALALSAEACGTNRPEIPDYLLRDDSGASGGNYPPGPYVGSALVGGVVENFRFDDGWMNPAAAGYDPGKLAPISFGDFYDPDGSKGYELVIVNTAAFWCGACKLEHAGTASVPSLNEQYDKFHPRGLGLLSLIFQDAASQPASVDDLTKWAVTYEERIPLARDPEYQMGRYASSTIAPLNLVVDARNMKILQAFLGDQRAVIWPFIDSELTKRGK